jgi:O-antigen/teichoic acid export membrane protein
LAAVLIVVWVAQSATVVLITSVLLDIGQIAFFWIVLHKNNCRLHWRKACPQLLGNILRYCAPMAIYIMINTLNRDMDKYLISMMTDTETLALYANASKQLPFDILVASFVTVLVPHITRYLAEQKQKQAAELYKNFLEIAYISTGILCCAALAAAPQLMKLLYSNKYTDALPIFCVYIFVDLFRFANITLVLSAAGKTRTLMLLGLGSLACNAVLNVVLYRWLDLIGPAIATLAVTIAAGILMLFLGARALNTHILKFFNWKYLAGFVAESVVLTVALSFLQQALEARDVHYFLILVIVAGLYCLVMLLLHGKRLLSAMKKISRQALAAKSDALD